MRIGPWKTYTLVDVLYREPQDRPAGVGGNPSRHFHRAADDELSDLEDADEDDYEQKQQLFSSHKHQVSSRHSNRVDGKSANSGIKDGSNSITTAEGNQRAPIANQDYFTAPAMMSFYAGDSKAASAALTNTGSREANQKANVLLKSYRQKDYNDVEIKKGRERRFLPFLSR